MDYEAEDKWATHKWRFLDEAARYSRSIRNADKKSYAARYALNMTSSNPEKERVSYPASLSAMAAQAVRMNLEDLFEKCRP